MTSKDDRPDIPLTRAEAEEFERPIRRSMWIGIGVAVAVLIVLIVLVMESRYRAGLAQPHPSAVFDGGLQEIVDTYRPLPDAEISLELRTDRSGDRDQYTVRILDQDGETLYQAAHDAAYIYTVGHGSREGDSIRFEVNLELDYDGSLSGRYRQDRGVAVAAYQAALQRLVNQSLAAYVAGSGAAVYQDDPDVEPDAASIRRDWDAVMDPR
ncbi:hypothetical protein M0534_07020 [Methylonatrum kenyense]|uniref:hypothetical protein n=1 Tax=Methylonatrum kenyense TaxID=455253 RepID=UPI0020C050B2|nr:hypothetical protein [Methylonatrum kenyense]MCK8516074.1 hypothetical protein [Methylonatrum kenyense]